MNHRASWNEMNKQNGENRGDSIVFQYISRRFQPFDFSLFPHVVVNRSKVKLSPLLITHLPSTPPLEAQFSPACVFSMCVEYLHNEVLDNSQLIKTKKKV